MGYKISDLQGASLPLTGSELLEVTQGESSRQVRVMDLLPGFDGDTLAAELANATDPAKGAGMVGWARSPVEAAMTVAGALSSQEVSLWEFSSLIADRSSVDYAQWDWTPALLAAISSCAGRTLVLPVGSIKITAATGAIVSLSNVRIRGDGRGKSVIRAVMPAGVTSAMAIVGDNVELIDFTLKPEGVSTSQVALRFASTSRRHFFRGFEIDGSLSAENENSNFVHGITISPTAAVSDVYFGWCYIHDCRFGLFTPNNLTGVQQRWTFVACHFYRQTSDDLEFNANDYSPDTWVDVHVLGCYFYDWKGAASAATGFAIGTDSGRRIKIQGCTFSGSYRQAVHIEDFTADIQVSGNTFVNQKVSVFVYQNNSQGVLIDGNTIIGTLGYSMDSDTATFPEPPTLDAGSVGVYIGTPGVSSSSTGVRVVNNVIRGCDYGINGPVDRGGVVENNTIGACIVGIRNAANGFVSSVKLRNNKIYRCKYAFSLDAAGVIGFNSVEDCIEVLRSGAFPVHLPDGIEILKRAVVITGSGVTAVPLVKAPVRIGGPGSSVSMYAAANLNYFAYTALAYDGATLSGALQNPSGAGSIALSSTAFSVSSGALNLSVYNSGSQATVSLSVIIKSGLVFR